MSGDAGNVGGSGAGPIWTQPQGTGQGPPAEQEDFEEAFSDGVKALIDFFEGKPVQREGKQDSTGHITRGSKRARAEARKELYATTVESASKEQRTDSREKYGNEGGSDADSPTLSAPEGGGSGNIFLQTEHQVAATLAMLAMIRMAAEDRFLDRESRTEMTMMKAEFQQIQAEMTKTQRQLEAQGQMLNGLMTMTSGLTQVAGGVTSLGMAGASATQARTMTSAKSKQLGQQQEARKAENRAARKAGNYLANKKGMDTNSNIQQGTIQNDLKADGLKSDRKYYNKTLDAARNKLLAKINKEEMEFVKQDGTIVRPHQKEEYAACAKLFTGNSSWKNTDSTLRCRTKGGDETAEQLPPKENVPLTDEYNKAREAESNTAHDRLPNEGDEKDLGGPGQEGKTAFKESQRLYSKAHDHHNNASEAGLKYDIAHSKMQIMNEINGATRQIFQGTAEMQRGLGQVMEGMYKMIASIYEYGSSQARIQAELIDSHMRIIDQDIDDARDMMKKALEVLQGLRQPSNKSANMRG